MNPDSLRATLATTLENWKRLLRSHPAHGQKVLRTLLDGPIRIGDPTDRVPWEARGDLEGLFGVWSNQVASPAGFEPALPA